MRKSMALGLLVAVCLYALTTWANAQGGWAITPGVGVGPFKLGMNIKKAESMLTRNPKADHLLVRRRPVWIYYNEGVQLQYDSHLNVEQIYVDKPGIPTPSGVMVGDPIGKALAAYGPGHISHALPTAKKMPKQALYVYKKLGLGFQTEGGLVKFIAIMKPL